VQFADTFGASKNLHHGRNQNHVRLFSHVAITSSFCNFVACFLFHFARSYVCARWHNLVCILRGGIFHCLSSSCLHCASFSRSHPRLTCATLCIVFTSHAAYIILTSVAGGNVRYFSVFLPNFFYVFFTCCSRNLPRENTLALQFE